MDTAEEYNRRNLKKQSMQELLELSEPNIYMGCAVLPRQSFIDLIIAEIERRTPKNNRN